MGEAVVRTAPHPWARKGWRFWLCRHCYAPKALHPRTTWGRSRPVHDNRYLSRHAPHFAATITDTQINHLYEQLDDGDGTDSRASRKKKAAAKKTETQDD